MPQRDVMSLATNSAHGCPAINLDALVMQARQRSAEFPDVLANHPPMILVALDRLGAGPERQAAFFDTYDIEKGLVPVPAPVDAGSWTSVLGDRRREADARLFFTGEVMSRGIGRTVNAYLSRLTPGVAGSALHPVMRLAYGLLRDDPAEVGAALGCWACCYLPLPPAGASTADTDDPGAVLVRVAAADLDFAPAVDWLRIAEATPAHVAATALALYAATMGSAALHAVTGAHWVRVVSRVCPDPMLLRCFWQSIAALVPSIGFPSLPTSEDLDAMRRLSCSDWPLVMSTAVASDDEHDISLVFSASEEDKIYGDPLYRVVAARRVGLIA